MLKSKTPYFVDSINTPTHPIKKYILIHFSILTFTDNP